MTKITLERFLDTAQSWIACGVVCGTFIPVLLYTAKTFPFSFGLTRFCVLESAEMECTVRKATEAISDESRLLEMEKLQRLVQTLQEKNEQLMAAVGSNALQNGDHQRRATAAVDPPRDSGIDLSASCSDDLEDDILDLDRFDMPDDEESW